MNMNRTYFLKKNDCNAKWHLIDASDKVLGRIATKIADLLRGKGNPEYTAHENCGDYVVVTNCDKIKLTKDKWNTKIYKTYSGWQSGLKTKTASELFAKDPSAMITLAVKGMLPKNKLSRRIIKRLKVYVGGEHPHTAQVKS